MPAVAINQRAFLVETPAGNLLWDCVALLDDATEALVGAMGGLAGIAISHPHYYTVMQDWAAAFGAPVWLHAADREWVMRPDPAIRFWEGDTLEIAPGATLLRARRAFRRRHGDALGGGREGAGVLLAGDILQVTPGRTGCRSCGAIPTCCRCRRRRSGGSSSGWRPGATTRIYGAFAGQDVRAGAERIVAESAARYIALLEGDAG